MTEPNPAVIAEPEAPQSRTYRVTGSAQETLGHKQGETFTALLDPRQERALLAGGAIAVVEAALADGPPEPVDPDAAPGPDVAVDGDETQPTEPEPEPDAPHHRSHRAHKPTKSTDADTKEQ